MQESFKRLALFIYNLTHFQPINGTRGFILAILISITLFVLVMYALHRLPPQGKKWLMIISTFIAGLFCTVEFFWPAHTFPKGHPLEGQTGNWLTPITTNTMEFLVLVVIWMIGLGVISLVMVHWRLLVSRNPDWYNSLAFFLAMIAIVVVGYMSRTGQYAQVFMETHKGTLDGANAVSLKAGIAYDSLFAGLLVNLDSAMFALLAFYIASAAYRAFRVRTFEAGLLMFAALVVMLGLVDIGVMLTSWIPLESKWAFFRLENFAGWILNVWNMPGQRAVAIGVAIGSLAMAMRLWLSLERGTFFSQEK